jgi:hypothetical protein
LLLSVFKAPPKEYLTCTSIFFWFKNGISNLDVISFAGIKKPFPQKPTAWFTFPFGSFLS